MSLPLCQHAGLVLDASGGAGSGCLRSLLVQLGFSVCSMEEGEEESPVVRSFV